MQGETMKDVKLDLTDKKYKFYSGTSIDAVIDSETEALYKVYPRDEDERQEFLAGGNKGVADLYWPELTMEEFKFLHPTLFKK